jgi:hypothetical protein
MRILFLDRSTRLQTVEDLTSRARGGMVSSLFALPDNLQRMGHECTVMTDIGQHGKTRAGTRWVNHIDMCGEYDFLVVNRGAGNGYPDFKAKHRILWTHDLPHSGFIQPPKLIKAFSATVFMSNYAEQVWRDFYREIGKGFIIPNGVDRALFYPREKDLDYLIYASAPNRGLRRLPLLFDSVKSRTRPTLHMTAFSNMGLMHPAEIDSKDNGNGDGFELEYQSIKESEISLMDPLPQYEFAVTSFSRHWQAEHR